MGSDGRDRRPLTRYREGQNEAIVFSPTVSPDGPRCIRQVRLEGLAAQAYEMRIYGAGQYAITPPPSKRRPPTIRLTAGSSR